MLHMTQDESQAGKSGLQPGIDGRIVTFHGKSGEAQLKAILAGKDVALYRWNRGLDLELRTALAKHALSQKCAVLTSDASVIAALDAANSGAAETAEGDPISKFEISLGQPGDAAATGQPDR
jgi:hypothetical protein